MLMRGILALCNAGPLPAGRAGAEGLAPLSSVVAAFSAVGVQDGGALAELESQRSWKEPFEAPE